MKVLSARNLYDMKHESYEFKGYLGEMLGRLPKKGIWTIYGKQKHGKTAFSLILAKYLSDYAKVWYVSAEEQDDELFIKNMKRAEIPSIPNLGFITDDEDLKIENLNIRLKKRNAARIVLIDNMTVYIDEFKRNGIIDFIKHHRNILLIFISHEERNEPATSAGRYVKKMAKVIIRVEGLQAIIGGRCQGGVVTIHPEGAEQYGIVHPNK